MLTAGIQLGPYEIIAPLGAGGMGEVCRATDSNLKRSVAIKVLPASVAGDEEMRRIAVTALVIHEIRHATFKSASMI